MNAYVADRIARDHTDQLLADAVIARRIRAARRQRVGRAHGINHAATTTDHAATTADHAATAADSATTTAARARPTSRARAAVSRVVSRPYAAFHAWLTAGLL
jgi:hypothetical protein